MHQRIQSVPDPAPVCRWDVIFFVLAFVFVYTQLFLLPFTPFYFGGDHLIHISVGMRLLEGEAIYRDVFQITTPGTEVWYALLFSIFGMKVWTLNFTILLLNMALAWLGWYFSRQFFVGPLVYLAPAVLLIIGFRLFYIDGGYRLFSVVFALAATAVLMPSITLSRIAAAGVLCGLSSFFGQHRGVMAIGGLGLFLVWHHFRRPAEKRDLLKRALVLGISFAAAVFVTQIYFAVAAGFDNYYFALVTFLRKYYGSDPLSNSDALFADLPDLGQYFGIYSAPAAISRYLRIAAPTLWFYALVPWTYLAFLIYRWRQRTYAEDAAADRKLMLLCFVGLVLSVGVSAPSAFRLSHVAVPATVIFVWLLSRIRFAKQIAWAALILLTFAGGAYMIQRQTTATYELDMPAGRSAFLSDLVFERYRWVGQHTRPGDLFYEGHHPSFYFPFHLKNPTPMSLIRDNNYTPEFQVESVLQALNKRTPEYIVWPRKWSRRADERLPGDNLEPLWQFVQTNYEPVFVFEKPVDYTPYSEGDLEIWRLKSN